MTPAPPSEHAEATKLHRMRPRHPPICTLTRALVAGIPRGAASALFH
jgi:hypothetical protein